MTRKHFEALADALASTRPHVLDGLAPSSAHVAYSTWCETVRAIADACYASNPQFDRGRFEYAVQTRADRLGR